MGMKAQDERPNLPEMPPYRLGRHWNTIQACLIPGIEDEGAVAAQTTAATSASLPAFTNLNDMPTPCDCSIAVAGVEYREGVLPLAAHHFEAGDGKAQPRLMVGGGGVDRHVADCERLFQLAAVPVAAEVEIRYAA